ncbi:hypothetical protein AVEN_138328-1 [Araneus ventricosus]|uniref:Uncharacterized protein n=1 Tax=Araneus ventricosus TaxID=182803 RepID=A0A4Y2Q8I4_ARAVE|nr:hypothetical protein AVEN_138328-1 [Araneus ventricosus]
MKLMASRYVLRSPAPHPIFERNQNTLSTVSLYGRRLWTVRQQQPPDEFRQFFLFHMKPMTSRYVSSRFACPSPPFPNEIKKNSFATVHSHMGGDPLDSSPATTTRWISTFFLFYMKAYGV